MQAQADRTSDAAPTGRVRGAAVQPIGVRPVPGPGMARTPGTKAFRQLVRAAGIIFSGTVTNIQQRSAADSQSLETVAITFHVDNAIRGTAPGENLTITQWIGLWSGGQRYRVGERVALFLYPASRLGLTSSVAGPMGRFEMEDARRILISEQHRLAFRGDPVLGGRSRLTFRELAQAVHTEGEDEGSHGRRP
ncbi:MAG TPA: hypothetical protein VHW45_06420 [Candidatus Sulfotelmatobacter sp.]|nr:hypothetical protein [Candidatus Sulfotelmatobacter sp.]